MTGDARPGTAGTAPGTAPVRVTDRCAGCGACLLTCHGRAIRPVGGALLVLPELCDGCGDCVEICPVDAIADVVDDAMDEVPDTGAFPTGTVTGAGSSDSADSCTFCDSGCSCASRLSSDSCNSSPGGLR